MNPSTVTLRAISRGIAAAVSMRHNLQSISLLGSAFFFILHFNHKTLNGLLPADHACYLQAFSRETTMANYRSGQSINVAHECPNSFDLFSSFRNQQYHFWRFIQWSNKRLGEDTCDHNSHSTPCSFFSLDLDFDFGFDLDGFLSLLGFLSLFGFLSLLGFFLAEGGADLAEDGADLAEDGLAESGLAVRWSSAKWSLSQIWARIAVCNAYPICGRHEATRDWSSSP